MTSLNQVRVGDWRAHQNAAEKAYVMDEAIQRLSFQLRKKSRFVVGMLQKLNMARGLAPR